MSEFGDRLREERLRLKLSQAKFAEACGIKRTAQTTYESGERSPSIDYLKAIEKVGVDAWYVWTGQRAGIGFTKTQEENQLRADLDRIENPAPEVDSVFLAEVLRCVACTQSEAQVSPTPNQQAELVAMLYRVCKPVGKVDIAVAEHAMRMLAII